MKSNHSAATLAGIALAFVASASVARVVVRPIIPEHLDVPLSRELALGVHAAGFQIYTCSLASDSSRFEWTLEAPEADLFDAAGRKIGRHYGGPTWELVDGSRVGGKVVAHADAPDGKAIPWLLLDATGHVGAGLLAQVSSIQRLNTDGGAPPGQTCDDANQHARSRVPYSATYYFYASDDKGTPGPLLGAD